MHSLKKYPSTNLVDLGVIVIVWGIAIAITAIFLWIVGDVFVQGISQISWEFLTTNPINAGREGGIFPILVSTGLVLVVCLGVALPLGVGTAVLLTEFIPQGTWFSRSVGLSLDILAGAPSIVFGLFGNVFFAKVLGLGFSILSGGLTLACMVLPILIRGTQTGLQSVPQEYRQAASALGIARLGVLKRILLPAAMPGIAVGLLLGIARAIAETAALIFTSGYVTRMPHSLLDSGRTLSIHIYDLAMNVPGGEGNAYATALVLIIILVLINASVFALAMKFQRSSLR
jgi:phosphate transport system permease protein